MSTKVFMTAYLFLALLIAMNLVAINNHLSKIAMAVQIVERATGKTLIFDFNGKTATRTKE